jgi:hypothetical protein
MLTAKKLTHPKTKVSLSIKDWASKYQIQYGTFAEWGRRYDATQIFDALDNGLTPAPARGNQPAIWINPDTNEALTLVEWAKKFDICTATLATRIKNNIYNLVKKEMQQPRMVQNPFTEEWATLAEWAENYFGVCPQTLVWRLNNYSAEDVFKGNIGHKKEHKLTDKTTGQTLFTTEWAQELKISPKAMKDRIKLYGTDDERLFLPMRPEETPYAGTRAAPQQQRSSIAHVVAQRNNVLMCTNPRTKETMLASEWAKHYRVSLHEFYQAMKTHGRNSAKLYLTFEKRKISA